jgi:ATP-dependent Clp protease ATP-binding subunit ClpB
LKRVIQRQVMNELSKQILAGTVTKDSDIVLDVFDNKMVFRNRTEKEVAAG